MGSIGAPEILVILVVALLVLGPERLPEVARQAGKVVGEIRRMSSGFQAELRDAMNSAQVGPTGDGAGASGSANGSAGDRVLWSELPPSEPPAAGSGSSPAP